MILTQLGDNINQAIKNVFSAYILEGIVKNLHKSSG